MNMMTAVKTVYSKYATFTGRARRSEFWWYFLFYFIVNIVLGWVDSVLFGTVTETGSLATGDYAYNASTDTPVLSMIFALASLLPSLAVTARRLHDINRSGWWMLISLIPIVGLILMIVWAATGGDKGPNRFGPDPIDGSGDGGSDGGAPDYAASAIPPVKHD